MAEIGISPLTLLRSVAVAAVAVGMARRVARLPLDPRPFIRRVAWLLLLAPFFTPVLLTGYAYANFSLSLIHHPHLNALFYSALLLWKFTPVAAVILCFTPRAISEEAVHCRRLLEGGTERQNAQASRGIGSRFRDLVFRMRAGAGRGPAAAFAVVFLCAFGEFEMASLMGIDSWTVTLFDAHAGGIALTESLQRMVWPMAFQVAALAIAVKILGRQPFSPARAGVGNKGGQWVAWSFLGSGIFAVLVIPALIVLSGGLRGSSLLAENFTLGREIVASLLFAAGATLAVCAATFRSNARDSGRFTSTLLVAGICIGLLGPLVLSLAILALVQWPGVIALRNTPVPLLATLGLVLLPMAFLFRRVLDLTSDRSALHLVSLMPPSKASRDLAWKLETGRKFWIVALLFVWAYWDLTASAILAPMGMTPATVRLYNLMHYGRIAALSAMTCAAFAAPVSILLLARGTRVWWARR